MSQTRHCGKRFAIGLLTAVSTWSRRIFSDDERGEAGRVGKFTVVARPSRAGPSGAGNDGGSSSAEGSQDGSADDETGALPEGLQEVGTGGAKFGVTKYVYYGRQSEGNR